MPREGGGPGGAEAQAAAPDRTSWRRIGSQLIEATRDEYVIEGELGRGGMAAVYRARDLRLNRLVAIKVMSPMVLADDESVERFRQEARTVAGLSHANIVTIHAVRQVDDLHFFVMKLVEGRALDRVLRDVGPLPPELAASIAFQVGQALAYAHRRGVIHRDIKPANILLDVDGNAVVTDFGIAKVAEATAHTRTGMLIGTPSYMSPEQCMGLPVSAASDQYSLGVVVYEMLTGQVPYRGSSLAVLQQHIGEPIGTRLASLAAVIPPHQQAALERMLAKNPSQRFSGALHAAQALGGAPLGVEDPVRDALAVLAGGAAQAQAPAPAQVRVSLAAARVEVGEHTEAIAEVTAADGIRLEGTTIAWRTVPADIAVIDSAGRVVGLRAGRTRVIAAHTDGSVGETELEVCPAAPTAIVVGSAPVPFRVCEQWQPVVEVRDRRGARLLLPAILEVVDARGQAPAMSASGDHALAPAPDDVVPDGGSGDAAPHAPALELVTETEVEAIAVGTGVLRVHVGELTTDVVVTVAPALVHGLALDAPPGEVQVGDTVPVCAVAHDARGRRLPAAAVQWATDDSSTASVDGQGVVTARRAGTVTVRAEADGCSARLSLRIAPARVARVAISFAREFMTPGDRLRASAQCWDRHGHALVRPVAWRSTAPDVVRVDPEGWVDAVAPGEATLIAEAENVQDQRALGVTVPSATGLFAPDPPVAPADRLVPIESAPAALSGPEHATRASLPPAPVPAAQPRHAVTLRADADRTPLPERDDAPPRSAGSSQAVDGGEQPTLRQPALPEPALADTRLDVRAPTPPRARASQPPSPSPSVSSDGGRAAGMPRSARSSAANSAPGLEPGHAPAAALEREGAVPSRTRDGGAAERPAPRPARTRAVVGVVALLAVAGALWGYARVSPSRSTPAESSPRSSSPRTARVSEDSVAGAIESKDGTGRATTPASAGSPAPRKAAGERPATTPTPPSPSAPARSATASESPSRTPPVARGATAQVAAPASPDGRRPALPRTGVAPTPSTGQRPAAGVASAAPTAPQPELPVVAVPTPTVPPSGTTAPPPSSVVPPVSPPDRRASIPESAAAHATSADALVGMRHAIDTYAAGVHRHDVGAMQRVFPSMSATSRANWQGMFRGLPGLTALASGIEVVGTSGDQGTARFALMLSYPDPNHRGSQRCVQTLQFRGRLGRVGGTWFFEELVQAGSSITAGC